MKRMTRDEFHKMMIEEGTIFLEALVNNNTRVEDDIVLLLALAALSARLEKRLFS